MTIPSGRISNEPEEERERGKNAIYSGHLRLCLQPKGSARTPLRPKNVKIDPSGRGGGIPPIFLAPTLIFFGALKPPCKILEPYANPFWERSKCRRREKKEREKMTLIVDT
jgi:hypothetical protein